MLGFMDLGWTRVCRRSTSVLVLYVIFRMIDTSLVPGEFPAQKPVTWGFDVSFDLRLNKRLNKQSSGGSFETLSRPL